MIKEYDNRRLSYSRLVALILCIPTVVVMFLDWIRVLFLDELSNNFKIFDFIESKFTLLEIADSIKKLEDLFGDNIKNIIVTISVFRVLSILSIIVLFISILIASPKFIKGCSIFSLVMTSSIFGVFMYSLYNINSKGAEKGEKYANMVEPTAWPFVMLTLSILIVLITFISIAKDKSEVYIRNI